MIWILDRAKNDYTREEIIDGLCESLHIIKDNKSLVRKICKLYKIDRKTYKEIEKYNQELGK